ncbi:MAG: glycosyltransferase family 4 protein [Chloroflexi bacterium]|nr:glycosyltransferase family 4 protein [Chloroflexota bacterium]
MLSWEYPPHVVGGLGRHVGELLPHLAAQGVEVHLLTPRWAGGPEQEQVGAAMVYRLVSSLEGGGDYYQTARRVNRLIEQHSHELWDELGGFDLIHAHDWLVGFAACGLHRRRAIPLLATIHATERGRGGGALEGEMQRAIHDAEWWLCYEASRLVCTSRFMADEVQRFFQVPADVIEIIPNGVNADRWSALRAEDLHSSRERFAQPEEKIVFYVGRLVWEKGVHILVDAAPEILAHYPAVKFVVAGTGPEEEALRRRAAELGLGDRFHFTGFIPDEDRDRLFGVADCAVFPSLYEPFGIVALEAMGARVPVVASEVGGLREFVRHAETGISVYPNDASSLAQGVLQTLAHPEWAAQRAENAYGMIQQEYRWERIAQRTLQVYRRVVGQGAAVSV